MKIKTIVGFGRVGMGLIAVAILVAAVSGIRSNTKVYAANAGEVIINEMM